MYWKMEASTGSGMSQMTPWRVSVMGVTRHHSCVLLDCRMTFSLFVMGVVDARSSGLRGEPVGWCPRQRWPPRPRCLAAGAAAEAAGVREAAACLQGRKISALVCPVPMAQLTKVVELVTLQYRLLPWSKML
jgi:hypothetical protein